MFSHVTVGSNDLEASRKFYDATLGALGISPGRQDPSGRILYLSPQGVFMITRPINDEPACHANGGTIGFAAASPEQANAWHAAGVGNGGATCENPPGVREGSGLKLYLAYLRDPAGNKLCAMHRMPA